jgi:hypothetical protein
MEQHADAIRSLLELAGQTPSSTARLNILEEAVRLADTHRDVGLGIETRIHLMSEARDLLRGDVLTTAFIWSLAEFDKDPKRFEGRDLITEYRWVIGQLANLHTISRDKLEELLADFGRRLTEAGHDQAEYHLEKLAIAPDLGNRDWARAATETLKGKFPVQWRNFLNWDLYDAIINELFLGNEEKALELGGLLAGFSSKTRLSGDACPYLLLPLLKRGRQEDADSLLKRAWRSYQPQRCYYWPYGEIIKYLALTGEFTRAVKTYGECQGAIQEFTDPLTKLHFALDASVLFDRLTPTATKEISVRLPEYVPVEHDGHRYPVAALGEWIKKEATELADLFDRRNGTSYFREQLAERAELQTLLTMPRNG